MFVLKGTALKACELCLLWRTLHLSNYKCKTKANPPAREKKKHNKKQSQANWSLCFSHFQSWFFFIEFLPLGWFCWDGLISAASSGVTLWSLAGFHCSIRVALALGASPGWAWIWGMPRLFPDLLLGQKICDRKGKWIPGNVAGRCQGHIKHAFVWEIADV